MLMQALFAQALLFVTRSSPAISPEEVPLLGPEYPSSATLLRLQVPSQHLPLRASQFATDAHAWMLSERSGIRAETSKDAGVESRPEREAGCAAPAHRAVRAGHPVSDSAAAAAAGTAGADGFDGRSQAAAESDWLASVSAL